jgi:hypothetical protein
MASESFGPRGMNGEFLKRLANRLCRFRPTLPNNNGDAVVRHGADVIDRNIAGGDGVVEPFARIPLDKNGGLMDHRNLLLALSITQLAAGVRPGVN